MTTTQTKAYAAQSPSDRLAPFTIPRRAPGATDVAMEILYCGVCHSDLHTARGEWPGVMYPCVPGHEIVGRVVSVGEGVTRFKAGDLTAVGCMVDSCRDCDTCKQGLENYCLNRFTDTYNGQDKKSGGHTFGGYSTNVVVEERFCLNVPENLDLKAVAPLLCAGITTYSPLRRWKVEKGQKVGIVGLGGLGHMGVKFAHALGAHTVLFTTSPGKVADGKKLGADEVVISKNEEEMKKHASSFDFILDCVAAEHDINAYLALLKLDGTLCQVGLPEKPLPVSIFNLVVPRRNLAGSCIGGIPETQEMLDFCGENGIVCDVEMIGMDQVNEAWDRVVKADVKYRFVIDMASLAESKA